VQFGILGPVEADDGGRRLALGSPQQRALLADLLLHANVVMPRDRLVDDLWGDAPPDTAAKIVQLYVSALRKAIDPDRRRLLTEAPGYRLAIDPEQLDAARFERLAEDGRRLLESGDAARAAAKLRSALELWRGPALADVADAPFAQAAAARLEELRLVALESRLEAELTAGRHADVVAELEELVRSRPLRERPRALLMRALYRAGRQAEALEAYRDARRALVEVGIEPGTELRELERAILAQAPELAAAAPAEVVAPARKTVTALFADLNVAEPRDPEVANTLLADGAAEATRVLERFGAHVEQNGGSVVALFGIPRVHEDDALRALRAAIAVRASVRDPLAVALAAVTGETVVGDGPPAATLRPARAARAGEIVVAEETARRAGDAAELVRAEDGALLLRSVTADEAIPRRGEGPLVGREHELGELHRAFERTVRERRPQLVTLLGPAGIGKSRLARELVSELPDAQSVSGRCLPYGDGIAFWPLTEIVRSLPSDVATLLGDDPSAERIAATLSGEPNEETAWAARRVLEALARERPLVAVFDDLQWAEPQLLDLIEHVASLARDAPLLLLCLARPELLDARPAWGSARIGGTTLLLEPLGDDDARLLAGALGATAGAERIATAAEGNPLFIEQLVAVRGEGGGDELPPTITALLEARLDLLPARERAALQRASVAGKEFWSPLVADDAALDALVARDLVVPAPAADAYRFRHQLMRDTAYRSLPKRARAELHEQLADWIAERDAPDQLVGYHLAEAARYRTELGAPDDALADRAGRRLAAAGLRAFDRTDFAAARSLLDRAGELLRGAEREALLPALADALRTTGEFERSAAVIDEALHAGDERVRLRAGIAAMRNLLRTDTTLQTAHLAAESDATIAALEALGDEAGLADAWAVRAWIPWFRCRAAEAAAACERSIAHARNAGARSAETRSRQLLLQTLVYGPVPVADAIAQCEAVLAVEQPLLVEATAHRALAALTAMAGDFAGAREHAARDATILDELGLEILLAYSREISGLIEVLAGDLPAAEAALRAGYERLAGDLGAPTLGASLAIVLAKQGRRDESLELAHAARDAAPAEDIVTQVLWRRAVGGQELLEEALALAEQTDFTSLRADVLADLGRRGEALALYAQKGIGAA
jgi:DNA-binding SARP family transcriptional activator